MINKIQHVLILRDIYGALLTDKQREAVALHFEEDWSLAEIAEHMATSKQAVHDLLRRTVGSLEQYETKLGFAARDQLVKQRLETALDWLQASTDRPGQWDELITLIRQAGETL